MIALSLSVTQDDCPLSAASGAHDVAFVTPHWHYRRDRGELELRILGEAADREALDRGLEVMRSHPETEAFSLLAKTGATARVKLTLGTTHAMGAVADHSGYVTGPFRNVDGSERWELGFDDEASADGALETMDRYDEVVVRDRRRLDPATVLADVRASEVGRSVIEASRGLTPAERETIRRAIEEGYYEVPRGATLGDLATGLGVSDAAVSKTLRRAERKLLSPASAVIDAASGDPAGSTRAAPSRDEEAID